MSTFPQPTYSSKEGKFFISLKVPIDIQLEVTGLPQLSSHVEFCQPERAFEKSSVNPESVETKHSSDQISVDPNGDFPNADAQRLANASLTPLRNDNSTFQTHSESMAIVRDRINSSLPLEKKLQTPSLKNKPTGNLLDAVDSFNDRLAFVLNSTGEILGLGKLFNYSWEGAVKSRR